VHVLSAVPTVRLAGFTLPVDRLSATSIATFMVCPEQFRLERVKRMKSRRGLEGFIGSVHHGAVERLIGDKMKTGVDPLGGEITAAYERSWAESLFDEEPEWKDPPDRVAANGLKMLGAFVDEAYPSIQALTTEEWVEETIPGVPVPIVGKIDVCEENRTLELKTTGQKTATPKAKWVAQARIYQLFTDLPVDFLITTRQVTPKVYQPSNAPGLHLPVGDHDVTARTVLLAVEQINDLYARYGPDETWPLHGLMHQYQCRYCLAGPLNPDPICPAWRVKQ
jgi:hypothetical protein